MRLAKCESAVVRPACRRRDRHLAVLLAVWLVGAAYLSFFAFRGWVSQDDGALAQSAERVMAGELPHHDFEDVYTGGLAFLYAGAFQLLGIKLTSIRIVFYCFAAAVIPVFYALAARVVSSWLSVLTTLLCLTWSFPNYFTGIATWYVLLFSVIATWCLFRYFDLNRRRWLLLAGVCSGLALTVKITGLYYIAALALTLLFRDQVRSHAETAATEGRSRVWLLVTTAIATVFLSLLVILLKRAWGATEAAYFLVPAGAVCALLVWNEWREGRGAWGRRCRQLTGETAWFAAGVLLPVACFLAPFVLGAAVVDLYRGVFVLPQKRFDVLTFPLPPLFTLGFAAPLALALLLGFRHGRRGGAGVRTFCLVAALLLVLGGCRYPLVHDAVWCSVRGIPPFLVLAGVWLLLGPRWSRPGLDDSRRVDVFLMIVAALMVALNQFPFAVNVYFCYAVPLVWLALVYVAASQPTPSGHALAALGCFYLAFGVVWLNPGYFTQHPSRAAPFSAQLDVPRGGLWVTQKDQAQYGSLVALIREKTAPGSFIYATPDSPEVYFLAERKNPTKTLYDMFDEHDGRTERILHLLEARHVQVVVLKLVVNYDYRVDPALLREIRRRYPANRQVGDFLVFWKQEPAG